MVGVIPVNLIPKFYDGNMDNCSRVDGSGEIPVNIGSRVKCGEDFGIVKYIGEIKGHKGVWYGIEWDDVSRGKHDGTVAGVEYFKTSKPGAATFVRPNKISPSQTCADAIRKYYGDREDETTAAHRRTIINEWKREMKAPFIEMVGFEKIHQKQRFDRLAEACVHDQCVSKAGNIADLCPNVQTLDVSQNLFANWREVIQLSSQLPDLREMDLSKNRMAIDMTEDTLSQMSVNFGNLEKLNLSVCDYEWSDILVLARLWPRLREIVIAHNRITKITAPNEAIFTSLTTLRLDGNAIDSWDEILNLGSLRDLKVLSLNDCQIESIRFNDEPNNAKVDAFQSLEVLFLNRNRINNWRSISELDKLKCLKKLYFLKNPVQASEDYDTGSQLIIAKIGTLKELNGSQVSRELRRGAEYDYLKRHGARWKATHMPGGAHLLQLFHLEHCRFQELIDKYGVPDDSLLEKQPKHTSLTSQLIEITLKDEGGVAHKRKFPATMMVQKLATMAQRLFRRAGDRPTLYCLDQERDTRICLDNGMKDLNYFSVKSGDTVLVTWR